MHKIKNETFLKASVKINFYKKKNYTLAGNYYSKYMNYLEIKADQCSNFTTNNSFQCANKSKID
jgi:hypothetical protein